MKTKPIIFSIIISLIVIFCSAQNKPKNDLQRRNLKGNVKSVREISYKAVKKSGVIQKGKRRTIKHRYGYDDYIIFNDKGNIVEKNYYKSNESLVKYKHTYKYDDKGNKIEKNWYKSDDSLFLFSALGHPV